MKVNRTLYDVVSDYGYGDWGYHLRGVSLKEVYLYFKKNKGFGADEVRDRYDVGLGTFWIETGIY